METKKQAEIQQGSRVRGSRNRFQLFLEVKAGIVGPLSEDTNSESGFFILAVDYRTTADLKDK